MDARLTTVDSKHHYPPQLLWNRSTANPAVPRLTTTRAPTSPVPLPTGPTALPAQTCYAHLELLPILLPQHSSLYQAQLLQYNKLLAPGRGRGGGGLQTPPLPPILSTPSVSVGGTRSRSSSKVSNKDTPRSKQGPQTCHGSRSTQNNTNHKCERAVITGKDSSVPSSTPPTPSSKMPPKPQTRAAAAAAAAAVTTAPSAGDSPRNSRTQHQQHNLPPRPHPSTASPATLASIAPPTHSNSVPSTPHQHARKFSFESREPSPTANQGHSPRSAYSETNGNLPSLRPLPPRSGGCRYETIPERSRRRMPYSIGSDRLERTDLSKIKSKLAEDEERRLTTDMRELYDRLKPTSAVEEKRGKLVNKLQDLLNNTWPGHDIQVHLFGSSGNLLCSDDSDVDICITTPWKELEGVCMLAELLARHGMQKVVCVSSAKVPIVKIWDPELELSCDMNVNNTLALENTRMIRTYVDIDERVRPLAMVIKHWTRQRVVNDAAFGGTLSSYTWICMIIAFLQLRQPAVLPALHQWPHQKVSRQDGTTPPFADDVDKLRGFGHKNKSTLGELLFQFFRFYAHEFDYGEHALSVRLGKLMKKTERKHWHLAINNQLCVEEPFNVMRNLGNTADDTSFRGIHLELRRAFDAVAAGNLDECCEQFVFPKEEERIFQKPVQAPRPVLLRSASQQNNNNRGGRGGNSRGGGRQQQYRNNNNHHHHGNNRRASSSTAFDNNANQMYFPGYPFIPGQENMYMQPDQLAQTLSALQLQENNLRFLQYTQNQAMAQQQALAHAQRMQGTNSSQPQTSTERSRTNSFDNPPLTAPLRPEMFYWPWQGHPYYTHQGFTTYPPSPSNGQAAEHRRSPHRTTAASDAGSAATGSSLRSQSQPAARSASAAQPIPGFPVPAAVANSVSSIPSMPSVPGVPSVPARHVNGVPIPSFMPDDVADAEKQTLAARTPPAEEKYYGYYLDPSSPGHRGSAAMANGVPSFGDLAAQGSNPTRRRLSSDQFPHTIFDRISKRTSRSPSPLGHGRTCSSSTNAAQVASPVSPATGSQAGGEMRPVVVNGSAGSVRQSPVLNGMGQMDGSFDNPLQINQQGVNGTMAQSGSPTTPSPVSVQSTPPQSDRPLVVNGSTSNQYLSNQMQPGTRHAYDAFGMASPNSMSGLAAFPPLTAVVPEDAAAPFSRFGPRGPPNHLIAQLDLATENRMQGNETQHLSPVYENMSPSPTVARKFELGGPSQHPSTAAPVVGKEVKSETKTKQRSSVEAPSPKKENTPKKEAAPSGAATQRLNGSAKEPNHARPGKSESDHGGANGWQKIPKGKKKGADGKGRQEPLPRGEQPPKNESERKGG